MSGSVKKVNNPELGLLAFLWLLPRHLRIYKCIAIFGRVVYIVITKRNEVSILTKLVTLRKSGNSLILTAPSDLKDNIGQKYEVESRPDGSILYEPAKKKNIFDEPEWKNYDYQKAMREDPEIQPLNPVGKERLDK